MMKTDMRKKLRKLLLEVMSDEQEHSIPELKELIRQKTGYVYTQDYFESQWSGALKDLYSSGTIRRLERGTYALCKDKDLDENSANTSLACASSGAGVTDIALKNSMVLSKEETDDLSPLPLTELSRGMHKRIHAYASSLIQNDYSYLLKALSSVDLSDLEEEEKAIEELRRLWKLRDALDVLKDWL